MNKDEKQLATGDLNVEIGEKHNTDMHDPGTNAVATGNPDNAKSVVKTVDVTDSVKDDDQAGDILDFLKDIHQKAIDAINERSGKAKVNGSPSVGEKLYSIDPEAENNVLKTLESIQDPNERTAFYKEHKKMIATALQVKANHDTRFVR